MWDSNIYWSSHRTTRGTEFITIVKKCQHSEKIFDNPSESIRALSYLRDDRAF
jgi:hypothetical protein